jgi:hypothetical protein
VPKLTVITRKAYGGAYDVMSSKVGRAGQAVDGRLARCLRQAGREVGGVAGEWGLAASRLLPAHL